MIIRPYLHFLQFFKWSQLSQYDPRALPSSTQTHWLLLSFPGSVTHSLLFLLPTLCIRSSSIWKLSLDSSEGVPWLPSNSARSTLTSSTISKTGSLQTESGDPSGQSKSQISLHQRKNVLSLCRRRNIFMDDKEKGCLQRLQVQAVTEGLNCNAKSNLCNCNLM